MVTARQQGLECEACAPGLCDLQGEFQSTPVGAAHTSAVWPVVETTFFETTFFETMAESVTEIADEFGIGQAMVPRPGEQPVRQEPPTV